MYGNTNVYCRKEGYIFHGDLLVAVEDIPFFYKVTDNFNSTSAFSKVQLSLAVCTSGGDDGLVYPVMRTKELYNLDRLELTEENEDTIKFICNCKQYCWPPWSSEPKTEHGCLVEISQ